MNEISRSGTLFQSAKRCPPRQLSHQLVWGTCRMVKRHLSVSANSFLSIRLYRLSTTCYNVNYLRTWQTVDHVDILIVFPQKNCFNLAGIGRITDQTEGLKADAEFNNTRCWCLVTISCLIIPTLIRFQRVMVGQNRKKNEDYSTLRGVWRFGQSWHRLTGKMSLYWLGQLGQLRLGLVHGCLFTERQKLLVSNK